MVDKNDIGTDQERLSRSKIVTACVKKINELLAGADLRAREFLLNGKGKVTIDVKVAFKKIRALRKNIGVVIQNLVGEVQYQEELVQEIGEQEHSDTIGMTQRAEIMAAQAAVKAQEKIIKIVKTNLGINISKALKKKLDDELAAYKSELDTKLGRIYADKKISIPPEYNTKEGEKIIFKPTYNQKGIGYLLVDHSEKPSTRTCLVLLDFSFTKGRSPDTLMADILDTMPLIISSYDDARRARFSNFELNTNVGEISSQRFFMTFDNIIRSDITELMKTVVSQLNLQNFKVTVVIDSPNRVVNRKNEVKNSHPKEQQWVNVCLAELKKGLKALVEKGITGVAISSAKGKTLSQTVIEEVQIHEEKQRRAAKRNRH